MMISVAKDFSRFPAGRFRDDGPYSGQAFRDLHLVPALQAGQAIVVDLDGTEGFGSSFLEEAFGGLVRVAKLKASLVERLLTVTCSEDPTLVDEVVGYIRDAGKSP